jgi:hypothetical protein
MKTIENLVLELEEKRKKSLETHQETQLDRLERSYNCQDDTIIYGMSWNVTESKINKINRYYDLAIEQVKNGGYLDIKEENVCLYENGELVSSNLRSGQWGLFFILNDGRFCSIAKRKSTFDKKGFEVKIKTINYKCELYKITDKGYVIYKNIEMKSEEVRDFDFTKDRFSETYDWVSHLYKNQ